MSDIIATLRARAREWVPRDTAASARGIQLAAEYNEAADAIERLRAALVGLVDGVTAEVNEKGGGGYVLARLTDARNALLGDVQTTTSPNTASPSIGEEPVGAMPATGAPVQTPQGRALALADKIASYAKIRLCTSPSGEPSYSDWLVHEHDRYLITKALRAYRVDPQQAPRCNHWPGQERCGVCGMDNTVPQQVDDGK